MQLNYKERIDRIREEIGPDNRELLNTIGRVDLPFSTFDQCGYPTEVGVELTKNQLRNILKYTGERPGLRNRILVVTREHTTRNWKDIKDGKVMKV